MKHFRLVEQTATSPDDEQYELVSLDVAQADDDRSGETEQQLVDIEPVTPLVELQKPRGDGPPTELVEPVVDSDSDKAKAHREAVDQVEHKKSSSHRRHHKSHATEEKAGDNKNAQRKHCRLTALGWTVVILSLSVALFMFALYTMHNELRHNPNPNSFII